MLLVPTGEPPHKELDLDPGIDRRLAMCSLAVAGETDVAVSHVEADRPGASYTVDTLRELHAQSPEHLLTFLVGGDMAHSFPAWREPAAVLALAELGVAEREGLARTDIVDRLRTVAGGEERVRFFDMPRIDVSSSMLRRRVAEGRPVRHLMPDAVAQYVAAEGLYAR